MRLKIFLSLILLSAFAYASHNRGGYINYYNVGGNQYMFRVHTWSNSANTASDRCMLTLYIDCSDSVACIRNNGSGVCPGGGAGTDGVLIIPGVQENIYQSQTSYPLNPGTHIFTMIDPNRSAGIINLGGNGSQTIAFTIIDTFYVYNTAGFMNNSVLINYRPIDVVCAGQQFNYNAGMVDPDNDSLDYSIVRSFEDDPNSPGGCVQPIALETFPVGLTIDKFTGSLSWSPVSNTQGEYDISILIREYRTDPGLCKRVLISATVLDIPLQVVACANSAVAFSAIPQNACVAAGTNYLLQVNSTGAGSIAQPVNISAVGLPFTLAGIGPNATFASTVSSTSASGNFYWGTNCLAVKKGEYPVTFRTFDGALPAKANYKTQFIKIVSPPPTNLLASGAGNNVSLSWTAPLNCGQTSGNTLIAYDVYRIDSCQSFAPAACQTNAPSNYVNVATVLSSTTGYTDVNIPAGPHTYVVVARFSDCATSVSSSASCVVTAIENNYLNGKISVWPNPASGSLYLTSSLPGENTLKVCIINSMGETIFSKTETVSADKQVKYDISQFAGGLYFVKIADGNKSVIRKIIVE